MTSYHVYLRTSIQYAERTFEARSPQQALRRARAFAFENFSDLEFCDYEGCDIPVNKIEVCDEEENELAVWRDEELQLRYAASELLEAAQKVVASRKWGDLVKAILELKAAIALATEEAGSSG